MDPSTAGPDAQSLRSEFLLDPTVTYLNHGSFGACPDPVMRTYQCWQRELEREPVAFLQRRARGLLRDSRTALAEHVGCSADEITLVPNATFAMNMVARSLRLAAGDRVLITDHEYGAMQRLWQLVCQRSGATLVRCRLPVPVTGPDEVLAAFRGVLDDTVRVVSLSHVTSPTGLVLPVADVCRLARGMGATTVVDGAHGPGQVDLDLSTMEADFYIGNCHKWLCSPKSAGFLYARHDVGVDPLVVSWGWDASRLTERAEWQGTLDISAYLSVPASIRYQGERDWPAVRARCARDAAYVHERLLALPGVAPVSRAASPMFRQMVSVRLPSSTDAHVQERLFAAHSIEVPVTQWYDDRLLRVSVAAYNDRADLERLVGALAPLLGR